MLGIDITKISRFENPNKNLIEKVLHPEEIKEYEISKDKELFLAKRWAVKEALYKANNDYYHFNKVRLEMDGRVLKFPGYIITTTKEDNYYFAVVMKEK